MILEQYSYKLSIFVRYRYDDGCQVDFIVLCNRVRTWFIVCGVLQFFRMLDFSFYSRPRNDLLSNDKLQVSGMCGLDFKPVSFNMSEWCIRLRIIEHTSPLESKRSALNMYGCFKKTRVCMTSQTLKNWINFEYL